MNTYLFIAYFIFLGGMIIYQMILLIQKRKLVKELKEMKEKSNR